MGADPVARQVFLAIAVTRGRHGLVEDVVDGAQRERGVEQIGQQFGNATERTRADQKETEGHLPQPRLGHWEPEEELFGFAGRRGKGLVKGVVGLVELLVDELATDRVRLGELRDRLAGQGVESQLLACLRGQETSRGRVGGGDAG